MGGHYAPPNSSDEDTVAIMVPYRDREEHLQLFLQHIHPFLQKQGINYRIFVIEQFGHGIYNKGKLLNCGFREVLKLQNINCFIFNDVDLLPTNDKNLYTCSINPKQLCTSVIKGDRFYNGSKFGGVVALTRSQYEEINGFSNMYYGWGEDDDMFYRIQNKNMTIEKTYSFIGTYVMLPHENRKFNPLR